MRMTKGEPLRDFMIRFVAVLTHLDIVCMDSVVAAVKQAVKSCTLFFNLVTLEPSSMIDELLHRAEQFAILEEDERALVYYSMSITSDVIVT